VAEGEGAVRDGPETCPAEAQEWWRTLVDAAADAILLHRDGRIVFANRRAAELFAAASPEDLVGRPALDLMHPASRAEAEARTRRVLEEGGCAPPLELRYRRLDGSWFWGEGRPAAVRCCGKPAVLVIIRDVTERRRSEERFRDFAELASDWFWETGPDLRYTWFSPDVEQKTGVPAEWHYGKTRAEIAGPDTDPEALAANMRLMQERRPYRDLEFQRRGPTGDHWIRSNGKPVFDEDGNFLGYRGTGRDITAQKQAELALRESEERYRRLVELAPDAVVVHVGGTIRYANRRAAELVGFASPEHLVGRSVLEFVHPEDRDRVRARWREIAASGSTVPPAEIRILRTDGIERWIETRATSVVDRGEPAVLLVATDVTDRRRSEERLVYLARHDALTGLANRMLVVDRLEQAVRLAVREGRLAALLLVDLDGFKGLNDTFGHLFGDRVLQLVADRMRGELRACDTVGRLGGDEFAIVLPHIQSPADADLVAERLTRSLAQPLSLDGRSCRIAASIGIALGPEHARSAEGLLRCADLALYRAKARGRGGWVIFEGSMLAAVEHQRVIEAALRRHLADGSLQVFYQPLVELASGRIVGAEALVRWPSGDSEQLTPEEFVSVAEESGLIGDLGRLVLTRTLADFRHFCALAGRLLRAAVNISPHELVDRDYDLKVQAILAQADVPGELLELEITERVLLERRGEIAEVLARLRSAGVQLAIDDFGTGYSSLTYLKHLPVHRLKLDRTFVSGLPDDRGDRAIVEAIVGLARAFRLPVIAEGVERPEQVDYLRRLGVQDGQGYYFAPPLPRQAFEDLLRREASSTLGFPLEASAPFLLAVEGHALIPAPTG
jgi:diguanylate cyclase (GGDEF)-like protein/PAS domain S-box-containing protein